MFKRKEQNEREQIKEFKNPESKKDRSSFYRLLALLVLFMTGNMIVLYFMGPYSKVGELSVSGYQEIVVQEVIDASNIHAGDSLWKTYFRKKEIEQKVKKNLLQVDSVKITLDGFNDLVFEVNEFETVAYLAIKQEYVKILENGTILKEKQKVARGGYPILTEFKEGKVLKRFLKEYSKIEDTLQTSISEIQYDPSPIDEYRIRLFMNDGNQVIASIPTFSERMLYYPKIKQELGKTQGELNLEAGAYFTPYDSLTDEQQPEEENEE